MLGKRTYRPLWKSYEYTEGGIPRTHLQLPRYELSHLLKVSLT